MADRQLEKAGAGEDGGGRTTVARERRGQERKGEPAARGWTTTRDSAVEVEDETEGKEAAAAVGGCGKRHRRRVSSRGARERERGGRTDGSGRHRKCKKKK